MISLVILQFVFLYHGCQTFAQMIQPPLIATDFKPHYYIPKGKEVDFYCAASGYPTPKIVWRSISNANFTTFPNGTLRIYTPTFYFESYKFDCIAENVYGKSARSFNVTEAYIYGSTSPDIDVVNATVNLTLRIRVYSKSAVCYPFSLCRWKWYKVIFHEELQLLPGQSERITVTKYGDLYFSYVTLEDFEYNGTQVTYVCKVSNTAFDSLNETEFRSVQLQQLPRENGTLHAHVTYNPNETVFLGSTADIRCNFPTWPPAHIEWHKGTTKNHSNFNVAANNGSKYSIADFGTMLIIYNIKKNDEDTYTCFAFDDHHNISANINLTVVSPPSFVKGGEMVNLDILEGSDANLNCHAKDVDNYFPRPIWYKNTRIIMNQGNVNRSKYEKQNNGAILRIKSVENSDTGTYQCTVKNEYGEVSGESYINVIAPIKFTKFPPDSINLVPGESVDLDVNATSSPGVDLFYNWTFIDNENYFHNQQYLQDSKQHILNDFNRQLDIVGNNLDSSGIKKVIGTYIVTVHNLVEVKERSIIVTTDTNIVPQDKIFIYKKDLVFLMDGSAEMLTHFNQSLRFMEDLVKHGNIDAGQLRVGFVIFSQDVIIELFLKTFTTEQEVINAIRSTAIPKSIKSNARNTASALRVARTKMFQEEFGGRAGAPDEAILIAAGKSNVNSDQTIEEARSAKASGIQITTIGLDISSPDAIEEIVSITSESGKAFLGHNPNSFATAIKEIIYREVTVTASQNNTVIIVNIIVLCLLLIFGIVVFLYVHRRHRMRNEGEIITAMNKVIKEEGLLSDDGLKFLASKLDSEWEMLATEMGLERPTIDHIKMSQPSRGADNMIFLFLKVWRFRSFKAGRDDTKHTRVIFDSLERCGKENIIRDIGTKYGLLPEDYLSVKDPFDIELQVTETNVHLVSHGKVFNEALQCSLSQVTRRPLAMQREQNCKLSADADVIAFEDDI